MLGTASKLSYICTDDFQCSADYLKYMYGQSSGLIARSTIHKYYNEDFNRSDVLLKRNYDGVENVYTSMNTFYKCDRHTEYLKRLNALYVDIDCYNLNMSKDAVLMELYDDYFGTVIPSPTFVIDSGRGLYLIWKINEDRNALPRWTNVMNYIFNACKSFNADPACKEASRVLRVPFSINSKSQTPVKIIDFNNITYTLHEIIREYNILPVQLSRKTKKEKNLMGKPTKRMKQYASVIAEQKGLSLPDFESFKDTFYFIAENKFAHGEFVKQKTENVFYFATSNKKSILEGRCRDLEHLFSLRQKKDCKREIGLFLYRLWLCESTYNYEYALNRTLLFNKSLKFPLKEKSVISCTASAERIIKKGNTYHYTKKRIAELLEISPSEMEELSFLNINNTFSADAKKARNRRAYLMRLEEQGKSIKATSINLRREQIAAFIVAGKSKSEICKLLGISTRTYERDMLIIASEGFLERAKATLVEKTKNIVGAVKNTANRRINVFKGITREVGNAVIDFEGFATKIKPLYWKRTPVGCSADVLGESSPRPVQLSLWGSLDDSS